MRALPCHLYDAFIQQSVVVLSYRYQSIIVQRLNEEVCKRNIAMSPILNQVRFYFLLLGHTVANTEHVEMNSDFFGRAVRPFYSLLNINGSVL